MGRHRATTELLIGFALSLVLHGTLMVGIMRAKLPVGVMAASFLREEPPPLRNESDPVPLGLDESIASSQTWIGFEEFQEQSAAPAEVEQGAFTTRPGPPSPQDAPAAPMAAAAGPEQAAAPPGDSAPPADAEDAARRPVDLQKELQAFLVEPPQGSEPVPPRPAEEAQPQDTPGPVEAAPSPGEKPRPPEPDPVPVQVVPAVPPSLAPGGEPGQLADQESDPASVLSVNMEQLDLGKPLATQGLHIKPRKPVFTTLMLLTATPGNPTAELRFRRSGVPVRVKLLESSGDLRIDEAVTNCLYKWRAAGKKLAELKEGQTFPVRIRILLH